MTINTIDEIFKDFEGHESSEYTVTSGKFKGGMALLFLNMARASHQKGKKVVYVSAEDIP